jgi:hypothetical protein
VEFMQILIARPDGKRTFGRCGHRREDNAHMDLKEI